MTATDYRDFGVLYVDDEPANLTAFRYAFEEQFRVLTARDGAEALQVLARESVAVLLADQRMPGLSGAQLCASARELFPDVVRMVVSAYADLSAAIEAINNGQVSRYILKPWREEELAATLRAAVDAFQVGALVRGLQTRLLQREQQAGAQLAIDRVLHELGNPLGALKLGLLFTARSLGPAGAPFSGELLDEVRHTLADALEASRSLEERIRYFRNGGALAVRAAPRVTDLGRAVMSAVAIVRGELQARARLSVDIALVPTVSLETVQASQVLVNLLVNACEAIEPGAPARNQISVRVRSAASGAVVEVEDSGCGIAPEQLGRVFDSFVTRKKDKAGHGLGLAIVRDIVTAAGGRVSVSSEVGRGSTFCVELPATPLVGAGEKDPS